MAVEIDNFNKFVEDFESVLKDNADATYSNNLKNIEQLRTISPNSSFDINKTYNVDDIVFYNNSYYICTGSIQGEVPDTSSSFLLTSFSSLKNGNIKVVAGVSFNNGVLVKATNGIAGYSINGKILTINFDSGLFLDGYYFNLGNIVANDGTAYNYYKINQKTKDLIEYECAVDLSNLSCSLAYLAEDL